jgi:hypothetical protein
VITNEPHPRGRVLNKNIAVFDLESVKNEVGASVLKMYFDRGDFIIFTTSDEFAKADATSKWIQETFPPLAPFHDFTMIMRRDGDPRPVLELKHEFGSFIKQFAEKDSLIVSHAFDMDPAVVSMYATEYNFPASVLNETKMQQVPPAFTDARQKPVTDVQEKPFVDTPEAVRQHFVVNIGKAFMQLFPGGVTLKSEQDINEHLRFISTLATMLKPEQQ